MKKDIILLYSDILQSFNLLEHNLKNNIIEKNKGLMYLKGSSPILISAPHSVEQTREGKIKLSESRTASIASFINNQYGCHSVFKTINFDDDANYDDNNYYKDFLSEIIKKENIKLLFDLHIMGPQREHNIDIGTGVGNNIFFKYDLTQMIKSCFENFSIDKVNVDNKFKAGFKNTVSSTISRENNIPCFQFEINWKLIDENNKDNKIINILNAFGLLIDEVKKNF